MTPGAPCFFLGRTTSEAPERPLHEGGGPHQQGGQGGSRKGLQKVQDVEASGALQDIDKMRSWPGRARPMPGTGKVVRDDCQCGGFDEHASDETDP